MLVTIRGYVWVRKNGLLIREGPNLVTTAGFTLLASIIGASGTKPTHMAGGSSSVATTVGMTALQGTEHQRKTTVTTVNSRTVSYASTFGPGLGASQSFAEFGVFNAGVAGDMLCRFVAVAFLIAPTDDVDVTWSMTIGD
jgi:hypothetical protein